MIQAIEKYNGTLPTKIAIQEGIDRETLRKAFLRGDLQKISRGVYTSPDAIVDDYFALSTIYNKGIISHESAVLLWEFSTFAPFELTMTFPRGYHSKSLASEKIKPIFVSEDIYSLGITETTTWFGNTVQIYNRERTVLDMLASKHSTDAHIKEMWQNYFEDDQKNLEQLESYARLMKREKYLEGLEVLIA